MLARSLEFLNPNNNSHANITFDDVIQVEDLYKVTFYRWVIFFFFFLNLLVGSSTNLTFVAISIPMSQYFGVSLNWITMLSNVFNLTYVPMTFAAMYMFKKMPSALAIRIAAFLFLTGAWIRQLFALNISQPIFWPILLGQTLISCSFPILACAITLIANKWFGDNERELATSLGSIAIPGGNLVAFVWTGIAFHGV